MGAACIVSTNRVLVHFVIHSSYGKSSILRVCGPSLKNNLKP